MTRATREPSPARPGTAAQPRGTFDRFRWRHDAGDTVWMSRRRRRRSAGEYDAFTPFPVSGWQPAVPAELAGAVSAAEAAIGALNAQPLPALRPLARLLLRTESVASSKAEGLQVRADQLARAEVLLGEKRPPQGATSLEILQNVDAMETAVAQAAGGSGFTVANLLAIHARLLAGHPHAGVVRTEQNWIGGTSPVDADFVPPPHERVPALLQDLVAAIDDDTLPPVLQAAIVHAQFETIHPFLDGNGRSGRALIHVVWRRRGLAPTFVQPISVMFSRDRQRYVEGLTAFRAGAVDAWFAAFTEAAAASAEGAQRYLEQVTALQQEWRERIRGAGPRPPRADAAVWRLIDELPAHPAITSNLAGAALSRTKPAVNEALAELERAGVLKRTGSEARNRVWEVPELLQVMQRFDG